AAPAAAVELKNMVNDMFRAPAAQPAAAYLPSLETEAEGPVVPPFSSLTPRTPDKGTGKPPAADPEKVREDRAKSTVFVKLVAGPGMGSGSGFVIRTQETTALVATNYHVIRPVVEEGGGGVKLSVVFDSGIPATEQELP